MDRSFRRLLLGETVRGLLLPPFTTLRGVPEGEPLFLLGPSLSTALLDGVRLSSSARREPWEETLESFAVVASLEFDPLLVVVGFLPDPLLPFSKAILEGTRWRTRGVVFGDSGA